MIDPLPDSISDFKNSPKSKIKKISRPLEDLILEMSLKDDDRETAVKAFDEIIIRFADYLGMACRKALYRNNTYDPTDLKTLVNNTFLFLYLNAENLLHIETLETEKKKEAMIKSWLGTVAGREAAKINGALDSYCDKNKLKDFADYDKEGTTNDDEDTPAPVMISMKNDEGEQVMVPVNINTATTADEEESLTTEEMKVMSEALNECTEREQEIILTYYDFLDGRKHLPREEIARLCQKFGILPDNLNHIKDRTFKKIKQKSLERMRIKNSDYRLRE